MEKYNSNGYSVVIAVVMIGFLLILTSGVFNLVLRELNDTRAIGNYFKAYAGAEASQELALLQIKKNGFTFFDTIDHNPVAPSERSIILSKNPLDTGAFIRGKDTLISYNIDSVTDSYSGILESLSGSIIPLFYKDTSTHITKSEEVELRIISGSSSDLVWNIVGDIDGISGSGGFDAATKVNHKKFDISDQTFSIELDKKVGDFIASSDNNYLMLLNTSSSTINFELTSGVGKFTKPDSYIISSGQVGHYKQNLKTIVDNTKFLNILKYSIFSK